MLKRGTNLRYTLPKFSPSGYHALMISFRNMSGFDQNDIAKFRLKVLVHLYRYGWQAASDACEVKKSTLFDWKRRFERSGKKLISLVPISTRPKTTRSMVVDPRLVDFIKSMRETYGPVSKYKIKPFLDEYARSLGLTSYGREKIGKIIKRNHYFFETRPKLKKRLRLLVPRLKKAPRETIPGYLEMDSVTLYVNCRKYYFITVIDVVTKFAWVTLTTSLSSRSAKLALAEFVAKYPYPIREVQTDNGHEFLGEFDDYLKDKGVPHQFIYFHSPRINGVVERFNRTIQDEFINRSDELWYDINLFGQKLADYLEWYNTKRPHHSLDLKSPVIYMQKFQS